ncbi:hypothetical protein ABZ464_10965 [Streptomyces sp. NPDC005820]|uniref:hypothetical protein n=1 Tax=Streptomyces sp. NPDC005820 TaxID=3157069 RepID=UPI0033E5D772
MDTTPARTAPEALARLHTALRDAGVRLPSVRLDPVSAAQDERFALIDLGRCNFVVASRLADALAGRPGPEETGDASAVDDLRERVRLLNRAGLATGRVPDMNTGPASRHSRMGDPVES